LVLSITVILAVYFREPGHRSLCRHT